MSKHVFTLVEHGHPRLLHDDAGIWVEVVDRARRVPTWWTFDRNVKRAPPS
jgi:hypothetical protein